MFIIFQQFRENSQSLSLQILLLPNFPLSPSETQIKHLLVLGILTSMSLYLFHIFHLFFSLYSGNFSWIYLQVHWFFPELCLTWTMSNSYYVKFWFFIFNYCIFFSRIFTWLFFQVCVVILTASYFYSSVLFTS